MKKQISISILSLDIFKLLDNINIINRSNADLIHLDIMDGSFVPNISFGCNIVKSIKKYSEKPLDVHLMIINPEKYIYDFKKAGADIISIHYESCIHLNRVINKIKNFNIKTGLALNPHTPISLIKNIISEIDVLLLMSVNPGFSGQKFIKETFKKINEAYMLIKKNKYSTLIEVDGGINLNNYNNLFSAGADILVSGTAIFNSCNIIDTINTMKK